MTDELTTGDLVRRTLSGEAGAFALLVDRHLRAAYLTALAVVGNEADAEDIAQDAMVTAYRKLSSCREPERFSGWLMNIARNRALNHVRKIRVRKLHAVRQRVGAERGRGDPTLGLRGELLAALATLTPTQREVVLLHDLEGWTHGELARQLGISEGMSRQHLFKARRALRSQLDDEEQKEANHG